MPDTVSKSLLTDKVAESTNLNKSAAKAVVDALFEHITLHLQRGDKVTVTGFGSFEVCERAARQGVNPSSGEKIQISASKALAFKAGKSLKDSVNA
ncbi:HU family DNA-binding protein [soil metagenome]